MLLNLLILSMYLYDNEVSGYIKDPSHKALSEVTVCTASWNCTTSNDKGFYQILKVQTLHPGVIMYYRKGYGPVIVPISVPTMDIVLKKADGNDSEWMLGKCPFTLEQKGRYIGKRFKVFVPESMRVHQSEDIDYWTAAIVHDPQHEQLRMGGGPSWSSAGFPSWITESPQKETVIRVVNTGTINYDKRVVVYDNIIDIKGKSKDGRKWRFFGDAFETIEYKGINQETAKQYDAIMDTLCVDSP